MYVFFDRISYHAYHKKKKKDYRVAGHSPDFVDNSIWCRNFTDDTKIGTSLGGGGGGGLRR